MFGFLYYGFIRFMNILNFNEQKAPLSLVFRFMKKVFIQLHLAVLLAGFTAILGRLITLNEGLLVWWRLLIALLVLAVLMIFKKELKSISRKDFLKISGVGAIVVFHWVAFYGSIKYANVSVALVCFSATGFFTALLEPLLLRKKIDFTEVFLGLLVIAGIYIIFDFYPEFKKGILFGIVAAVGSAIFPIFNKELLKQFEPRVLTFYEFLGGLIMLSILLPIYTSVTKPEYYIPTNMDFIWLVILSVLCTVVMYHLQLLALKKISAFTVNLTYNLEPVYGLLMAFVFFNENKLFHSRFYIGLSLIILSILLHSLFLFKERKQASS